VLVQIFLLNAIIKILLVTVRSTNPATTKSITNPIVILQERFDSTQGPSFERKGSSERVGLEQKEIDAFSASRKVISLKLAQTSPRKLFIR